MIGLYLLGHTVKEFLRFRRLFPWLLLLAVTYALGRAWGYLSPSSTPQDQYGQVSSIIVFHMLTLCAAIYATAIVSQEVEQKTIMYLLTRPVSRSVLLLSRYGAMVIVVAAIGIASALTLSLAIYGPGALSNALLLKDIQALVVGAFAYGALFMFVSLLLNRAMLVCLLFAFGWETSVPNMPGELYRLSIFSYLQSVAEHPAGQEANKNLLALMSGTIGTNTISHGTAMTWMVGLTLVCAAASAWWFTNFEYVPREDAE